MGNGCRKPKSNEVVDSKPIHLDPTINASPGTINPIKDAELSHSGVSRAANDAPLPAEPIVASADNENVAVATDSGIQRQNDNSTQVQDNASAQVSTAPQQDQLQEEIAGGLAKTADDESRVESSPVQGEDDQEFPRDGLKGRTFEVPENEEEVELNRGIRYKGQWKGGKQNGIGLMKYADGGEYLGDFKDGKAEGLGIYRARDGAQYEGEFEDGKANGYGVYTFKDGSKYFGHFKNDKREGRGKEIQTEGLVYVGEYKAGLKQGKGELRSSNGEIYVGDFDQGDLHGHGRYEWPDGKVYEGQWLRSRQHGEAKFFWPDGRVYNGQYKDGKISGQGILTWPDGRKYQGPWEDGMQNGRGKYWKDPHHWKTGLFRNGTALRFFEEAWQEDGGSQADEDKGLEEAKISHAERSAPLRGDAVAQYAEFFEKPKY